MIARRISHATFSFFLILFTVIWNMTRYQSAAAVESPSKFTKLMVFKSLHVSSVYSYKGSNVPGNNFARPSRFGPIYILHRYPRSCCLISGHVDVPAQSDGSEYHSKFLAASGYSITSIQCFSRRIGNRSTIRIPGCYIRAVLRTRLSYKACSMLSRPRS